MSRIQLDEFAKRHLQDGGRFIPARVQAAMALLERLREFSDLKLESHKAPNSSGLVGHERWGNQVHDRLKLARINKNHGRRSSNVGGWGQDLLNLLRAAGFESAKAAQKSKIIDDAQNELGDILRKILDQDPLEARPKGRSAEAVIRELLRQADEKGKVGEVAQYLVGAKLQLRLGQEIPVYGSNKGDRKSHSDAEARSGDFEIENATIEVAVGLPDEKHLSQVVDALEDSDVEVWLLTRHDRVASWRNEVESLDGVDLKRVVITSVESFVGQNIAELSGFSSKKKMSTLSQLFALYNERWVAKIGTPGLRIISK